MSSPNPFAPPPGPSATGPEPPAADPSKLPPVAHLLCGWPLLLVAVGGLIGGLMGGLAYGINVRVYKSQLPTALKVVLNLFVGGLAVVLWLVVGILLHLALKG